VNAAAGPSGASSTPRGRRMRTWPVTPAAALASSFGGVPTCRAASSASGVSVGPALGTAMRRRQEPQHGCGGDVGPLRLGIMPGLRDHDDLRVHGLRDPGRLS
jgi:hypothetical protein